MERKRKLDLVRLLSEYDSSPSFTPEQRLLVAVFAVALKDRLCPEMCLQRKYRRTALLYFKDPREGEWGSLDYLCKEFGYTVEEVRRRALRPETIELLQQMGMVSWARKIDERRI